MSSTLTYNGITIPYSWSTSFNQEAVSEDSDTDWIGTKFDIKVQGYIHLDYVNHIAGDDDTITGRLPLSADVLAGGTPAIMKSIRSRLLAPRRTLSFVVNGIDMIPKTYRNRTLVGRPSIGNLTGSIPDPETPGTEINANAQGIDSMNGPRPQSCNITRITDAMFYVDYHIVAIFYENRRDRNINNVIGSNVLYNRWKETVEIDSLQYTKRTRVGKFAIRSDGTGVVPADVMNTMAVVGVPNGFVREGSQYTVSEDGLRMDYNIIDREVFKVPPDAALEAKGTYSETLGRVAAIRHGDMQLTLKSSKNISQQHLVHRCIVIAFAKLNAGGLRVRRTGAPRTETRVVWRGFLGLSTTVESVPVAPDTAASGIVESIKLTVNMYENEVSISIRVRLPAGPFTRYGLMVWTPLSDSTIPAPGSPPPTGPPVPPSTTWPRSAYAQLGTANIPLIAAAYYDPSLRNLRVNERTGQLENPDAPDFRTDVKVPGRAGDGPESFGF